MTATPLRALATIVWGGAALALVAGCGSAGSSGPLEPADAPAGWAAHTLADVTISTPSSWQEADPETTEGSSSQNLLLRGGDATSTDSPVANVTVVPEPSGDLAAEVAGVRATVTTSFGVTDFTEEEVTWPGASTATYLAYVGEQPADAGTVEVRSEWLFAELEDGTQVLVVVSSPEEDFTDALLHDVLATVGLGA